MKQRGSISLTLAIIININIMIGAGLFINPQPLTYLAGSGGFSVYLVAGIILSPIIIVLANLATLHPHAGGLYVYGATYLHPLLGFTANWSYFLGKLTSATLITLTFARHLTATLGISDQWTQSAIAFIILSILIILNCFISLAHLLNPFFVISKLIPLFFVIITTAWFLPKMNHEHIPIAATSYLSALPIAIFALVGFEAVCSMAHIIKQPGRSAKPAIYTSSAIVIGLSSLFQYCIYRVIGPCLTTKAAPFALFTQKILNCPAWLPTLFNWLVYTSMIGSAFGILMSNSWNLFTIAQHNHLPFSRLLTQKTGDDIPLASLCAQLACAGFILLISNQQIQLQNMAVFGQLFAFLISIAASFFCFQQNGYYTKLIATVLGTISCLYCMILAMNSLIISGISLPFICLLASGIIFAGMHYTIKKGKIHV